MDFQRSLRELDSQILLDFNAARNLTLSKKIKAQKSRQAEILLFHEDIENEGGGERPATVILTQKVNSFIKNKQTNQPTHRNSSF